MILVTGGTGLLGSHLLLEILRSQVAAGAETAADREFRDPPEGHSPEESTPAPGLQIRALKRPSSNLEELRRVFGYYLPKDEVWNLFDRIEWVDTDLMNPAEVMEAMKEVRQVYHCAAMVSFQPRDRRAMIEFNRQSTAHVVAACQSARVDKLIHVSSTSAIGRPSDGEAAHEDLIWVRGKNTTAYAESKFASEMEVWRGIEEGLPAAIVNPAIIFGPGFWDRGSSSMFSRVAGGLRYATPGVTGYVGVHDVVRVLMRLMESEIRGERFILSAGSHSYEEVFSWIASALGIKRNFRQASAALMRSLVRLDAVAGVLTGKRRITSDHLRGAFGEIRFSNEKVCSVLEMEFTPVEEVIREVAGYFPGKPVFKASGDRE